MDENNQAPTQPQVQPAQPVTPSTTPPITPTPAAQPTPPATPTVPTTPISPRPATPHSPIIIILIVLVLVLFIGGVMILMSRRTSPQEATPERSSDIEAQPTTQPTQAAAEPTISSDEEQNLDALDLGDVDTEFQDVEMDINKL